MIWALTHREYCTDDFGGYSGYHSAADGDREQRPRFRGNIEIDLNADWVRGAAPPQDKDEDNDEKTSGASFRGPVAGLLLITLKALSVL